MTSFQSMTLPDALGKALQDLQFNTPTEIQSAAIPIALKGRDLMACAQTGSGKTAAYCLPIIVGLLADDNKNALILAPTRELAAQIADVVRDLTVYTKHLRMATLVGGADIRKQIRALQAKPRLVIATPGRLTDHLKRRTLSLAQTGYLILDEGDRMIDMGFAPQLEVILKYLPKERQTLFFTATLPMKVKKLAEKYLNNPESIAVGNSDLPVDSIKQTIIQVASRDKDERLVDELNKRTGSVIIFAKTKRKTDELARYLDDYGFTVSLIHGDRTQGQRNQALQNFKMGRYRILCATDVAARGIDVPSIEHVINYDLPMMVEDYVHRIGRTGRNGASGEAVSFVAPQDHRNWLMIARKYKIKGVELTGGRGEDRRGSRDDDRRDDRRGGGRERRPFGKSFGGPRGAGGGERRSFGGGGRRFDNDEGGERRSFGGGRKFDSDAPKRSYDKPKFENEAPRKSYGDRPKFDSEAPRKSYADKPKFEARGEEKREGRKIVAGEARKPSSDKKRFEGHVPEEKRSFGEGRKPFGRKFEGGEARKPFGEKRKFEARSGDEREERKSFGGRKFEAGEGRSEGRKPFGGGRPGGFKKPGGAGKRSFIPGPKAARP